MILDILLGGRVFNKNPDPPGSPPRRRRSSQVVRSMCPAWEQGLSQREFFEIVRGLGADSVGPHLGPSVWPSGGYLDIFGQQPQANSLRWVSRRSELVASVSPRNVMERSSAPEIHRLS